MVSLVPVLVVLPVLPLHHKAGSLGIGFLELPHVLRKHETTTATEQSSRRRTRALNIFPKPPRFAKMIKLFGQKDKMGYVA